MKINELIKSIYTTNEEDALLETLDKPTPLSTFVERDQVIINNLIRKSIISTTQQNGTVMVMRYDM